LVKDVKKQPNIELVLCSKVNKVEGDGVLNNIVVENIPNKTTSNLGVDGLFVSIGRGPDTEVIDKAVVCNENGYIVADKKMRTNVEGVFVAGDIRETPLRQIVTACSDGAIAATAAFQYIKTSK
jgi:thioredoxin reductase (NADPH)